MKHFFFDLDGTICDSRTVISPSVRDILNKLPNVYVISGARRELMEKQLLGVKCTILAQSGNDTDKWVNKLSEEQKKRVLEHIKKIEKEYGYNGEVEDRICQMAYSFTGHNADLNLKKKFDPDKKIRTDILEKYPFVDDELTALVAGNTSIDYVFKNGTKGINLKKYIQDFDKNECIYFGDNLQIGGNDHSVVGVMETVPVNLNNIIDTLKKYV
jgi:hydroxymethylpyrimidine pyrophosphatase-like HAD family hydrolase